MSRSSPDPAPAGAGVVPESLPLMAVHLSRHKWPGGGGLGEGMCCPLSPRVVQSWRVSSQIPAVTDYRVCPGLLGTCAHRSCRKTDSIKNFLAMEFTTQHDLYTG